MRTETCNYLALLFLLSLDHIYLGAAAPSSAAVLNQRDSNNPLNIDWDPAPSPEDGPPASADALRDPAYLPAQIGGIIGSYALSLVLVAIGLLALAKRRREHLKAGEELDEGLLELPTFQFPEHYPKSEEYDHFPYPLQSPQSQDSFHYPPETPKSPHRNFSYPDPLSPARSDRFPNPLTLNKPEQYNYPASPTRTERTGHSYIVPSPSSPTLALGVDLAVDQSVVARDREMAQQQLEDMYKHVMEQEEAKLEGREYAGPTFPTPAPKTETSSPVSILKKEKNKPSNLNLAREEKTQSRTSSLLSAIMSPRKKTNKAVNISSPIMTPVSATFPRQEGEEPNVIPPRQYNPSAPPPVPMGQLPFRRATGGTLPMTPEMSPTSVTSIDGRLDTVLAQSAAYQGASHSRDVSAVSSEPDPVSAVSEQSSSAGLVGLPSSPKPGVTRFPSLPASPRPGQTFARAMPPPAVRTGGALPLRAYEPSLASPRMQTTKQTVFTRAGPLSPGGGLQTPFTGTAVPYSPYQPFSPVFPITPSLVTREDRKRMRRMEPKTPTVEMVKSSDETW